MSSWKKLSNWSKTMTALILCISPTIADVSSLSKNYLPPDEGGYNYNAPSIPFSTPSPYKPSVTIAPRPIKYSNAASYSPPVTYRPSSPPIYTSPKSTYGAPSQYNNYEGSSGGATGGGEFDHLRQPHVPGMPYDFSYAVKDDYHGTDFGHSAVSNGDQVRGEYRVALPDGRLQIVKYVADWKDGYTAEVTYQGEAKYPSGPNGGDYGRSSRPYSSPNSNYQRPSYSGSGGYSGGQSSGYSAQKSTSYSGYNQHSEHGRSSGYSAPSSGYGAPSQQSYSSPAPNYSSGPDYGGY